MDSDEEYADYELWQGGIAVASVSGPKGRAWAEICHYAAIYGRDGPVEIRRIPPHDGH